MEHMAVAAPRFAGFWIRFVAYIIDAIISGVLSVVLIGIIYLPVMWAWKGQTVGMMILNMKVVRAADGGPISAGTAIIRWLGMIVSAIPFCLGFIWIAFDARKQGWHDKIAGTVIIHTN
jgi:uncharacterized RDD family membrane protein YckC